MYEHNALFSCDIETNTENESGIFGMSFTFDLICFVVSVRKGLPILRETTQKSGNLRNEEEIFWSFS
jgi:hypothetical protein